MKKIIVAIGGGENGRPLENGEYAPYETEKIDKEIINLTQKKAPNFLFLGHGMHSSLKIQESYFETMKEIYGNKFNCKCLDLKSDELYDLTKVNECIEWADIIYEGGGDTEGMIKLWKETGFDKILYNAWQNGKIICGVSAGGVCWFKSCNSDSSNNESKNKLFSKVDCLNWINLHITPHCDEYGRYESTKQQLKDENSVGVMLSNCSALIIKDEKYRFISSDKNAYVIKSYWKDNNYYERKGEFLTVYKDINELLEKN